MLMKKLLILIDKTSIVDTAQTVYTTIADC